jgi:drug/metabolite transporter (DMT)-like permease
LQIPLAPGWVWLAFGEVPTLVAYVGGLVVVAAIASEAAIRKMQS